MENCLMAVGLLFKATKENKGEKWRTGMCVSIVKCG
jgi:hypothetical protein